MRPSNTQSVLSMRFESSTLDGLKQVIDDFHEALKPHLKQNELDELLEQKRIT